MQIRSSKNSCMAKENRLYSISLGVASLQGGLVGVATALSPATCRPFQVFSPSFFVGLKLAVTARRWSNDFSCADYFASDACVTTWVCESDSACTNVSTCRGETAGGTTTKKNGDTNVHLSPWILINVLHKTESSVTLSGCSP